MENSKNIVIDIETLGNCSNSIIASIAAIKFDIKTGETFDEFYKVIDIQSCIDLGMKSMGSTILWWLQNSQESRNELCSKDSVSLQQALNDFSSFCDKEYFIWTESPRFDLGIMRDAYDNVRMNIPWDFRKERDIRTIVGLKPDIKDKYKNLGILHNPVDDCKREIKYLVETYNCINII